MARYIDADSLCEGRVSNDPVVIAAKCEPTADVAPVAHAHWTCVNESENVYMCDGDDGCGNCVLVLEGTPKDNDMNFCPHCGARMDEETEK